MNVLVTGGAGFIGIKTVSALVALGDRVVVLDNLSPQIHGENADWPLKLKNISGVGLMRGDVNDADLVKGLVCQSDAIIHLAAETGTGQSMYEIQKYTHVNVGGSAVIFEAAAQYRTQIKRFIFASSRSVYGEGSYADADNKIVFPAPRSPKDMAAGVWDHYGQDGKKLRAIGTKENHGISPASIYAATKYATELYCRIVSESYGIAMDVLRFQNVYGEGQSLKNPYTGILSIFSNLFRQNKEINIFEDGQESRDFVHVSDVVNAIQKSLKCESSGFNVFNIGTGNPTSVMEVAKKLKAILGSDSIIRVSGDFRVGDIRHCFADTDEAQQHLGFQAAVDIDEGLSRFCKWVCSQEVVTDDPARAMEELKRKGLTR